MILILPSTVLNPMMRSHFPQYLICINSPTPLQISVYFFAEILPIGISLQNDYLDSLTDKPGVADGVPQCLTPIWNCEEKTISRLGMTLNCSLIFKQQPFPVFFLRKMCCEECIQDRCLTLL